MAAAEAGRAECARLLAGAEAGMRDGQGRTALMLAAENGHAGCLGVLAGEDGAVDGEGKTALMHAVAAGKEDCVGALAEREGGLTDKQGRTALMAAARGGKAGCVGLLVRREGGAADQDGRTALWHTMAVIDEGHRECFLALDRVEGERKTRDYETAREVWRGCSCGGAGDLFEAAERGCCMCCWKHIGQAGKTGDIHFNGWNDSKNRTALMVAAFNGHTGCVRILA